MKYRTLETETFRKRKFEVKESVGIDKGHDFITIKKNWELSNGHSGYHSIDMYNEVAIKLRDKLIELFPLEAK